MEYIRNSQGNRKQFYEGFVYVLDLTGDANDARKQCPGRLSTLLDTLW